MNSKTRKGRREGGKKKGGRRATKGLVRFVGTYRLCARRHPPHCLDRRPSPSVRKTQNFETQVAASSAACCHSKSTPTTAVSVHAKSKNSLLKLWPHHHLSSAWRRTQQEEKQRAHCGGGAKTEKARGGTRGVATLPSAIMTTMCTTRPLCISTSHGINVFINQNN